MTEFNDIKFKPEVTREDLLIVSPAVLLIFSHFCLVAKNIKKPIVVTSIMSDGVEGRISSSHKTGRAIDVSSHGWDRLECERMEAMLNDTYSNIGAISAKDGNPHACVYHNKNTGWHFHLQCKYFCAIESV